MAPSNLVKDGMWALQAGRRDEALSLFMDAVRENRFDEDAWFHLGTLLDDAKRKKQAFERVLKINPDNQRAQAELEKLKPPPPAPKPTAQSPAQPTDPNAPEAGTLLEDSKTFKLAGDGTPIEVGNVPPPTVDLGSPSQTGARRVLAILMMVLSAIGALFARSFRPPFKIDGAPPLVNLRGLMSKWLRMGLTSLRQLVTNKLIPDQETAPSFTLWEALMFVLAGAFCFAAAETVGRFVRGIFELPVNGLGGMLVTPIFAGLLGLVAVAAGVLVGGYAGQVLFERQISQISITTHLGLYASVILAAISAEALLRVIVHVLVGITRNGSLGILVFMLSLGLTGLLGYLLFMAWKRFYELDDNTTVLGMVVTVGGGWLMTRLILLLFGAIFRIPFF
jgi:hypothetical protein